MTGRRWRTVRCDSCDVLVINNLVCHEFGCPDSLKDDRGPQRETAPQREAEDPDSEPLKDGEFFEPLDAEQREALRRENMRRDDADVKKADDLEDDARTAQAGDAFNLSPLSSRPGWTL